MNKCILHIVLLLIYGIVNSQVKVEVQLLDSTQNKGIDKVEVYVHSSDQLISSNEKGKLVIELDSNIETTLSCFSPNYYTKSIQVKAAKDTSITLFLEPLSIELTPIEIAAKREAIFALRQLKDFEDFSIFAGKKSEVVILDLVNANLATNNSRQIYAQVAGLNIYEGSDGGLQLNIGGRGLDPNRSANFNIRQNGYDLSADVLGYPESYYTPPSEAIEEIKILRGASSLQYGTQFGGLVEFKLKEIPSFKKTEIDLRQSYGSFNNWNSFNRIGLNYKKLSYNGFINYKKGNGFRANSNFEAITAFNQFKLNITKKLKLSSEYTYHQSLAQQAGGLTDLEFNTNPFQSNRNRNWFRVDWNLFNLKLSYKINKKRAIQLNTFGLSASRKAIGFRGNPISLNQNPITAIDEIDSKGNYILPRDIIIGNFKNYGSELRFLNDGKLFQKRSSWLLGLKYYNAANQAFQGPGSLGVDANFEFQNGAFAAYPNQSAFDFPNKNLAAFYEQIIYVSKKLLLVPGIRFEHISTSSEGIYTQTNFDNAGNAIAQISQSDSSTLKRSFLLKGIGLKYVFSEKLNVNFNLSQNYRSVTFSDIRVVNPSFIISPDIRDESGYSSDLSMNGRLSKYISYNATIFSLLYNDRIGVILDDRANRVRKNIGQAIILGTESLLDLNLSELLSLKNKYKIRAFANSAFTYSNYLSSEENNVVGKKVEFVPSVNIKVGTSVAYGAFKASLQYSYISKQFTDVQNSEPAIDGDIRSGIIGTIPSYSIVDCSLSYGFNSFQLSLNFNNLLNTNYFTRRALGYPGPGIIPSEPRTVFITLRYFK